MDINVITNLISSIGFPIFVAVWLLLRSDKREAETQAILVDLKNVIVNLSENCKRKD